jgi:hypothetical protein
MQPVWCTASITHQVISQFAICSFHRTVHFTSGISISPITILKVINECLHFGVNIFLSPANNKPVNLHEHFGFSTFEFLHLSGMLHL